MNAEKRNSSGSTLVSQSGLILVGAMSISVPSDDWCMQDSTTPATMNSGRTTRTASYRPISGRSTRRSSAAPHSLWSMRPFSPSRTDGLISTASTMR